MKEVAVGIILDGHRVLACRRKATVRYPLKWEFPGGKLEPGENAEHALFRELKEELNIDAEIGRKLHCQEWTYDEGMEAPTIDGTFHVSYFVVPSYRGRIVNKTFHEIRWVTPLELRGMDILEGNREAVERLIDYAAERQTA